MKYLLIAVLVSFSQFSLANEISDLDVCSQSAFDGAPVHNLDSQEFANTLTTIANSENGRELWMQMEEDFGACTTIATMEYMQKPAMVDNPDQLFITFKCADDKDGEQGYLFEVIYDLRDGSKPVCFTAM